MKGIFRFNFVIQSRVCHLSSSEYEEALVSELCLSNVI
jgi:hypothetical protein